MPKGAYHPPPPHPISDSPVSDHVEQFNNIIMYYNISIII